jgi:hypothetical protein
MYFEENGEYLRNNPTWHFEDSPRKVKITFFPRELLFKTNKDISAKILGSCSLLVLANKNNFMVKLILTLSGKRPINLKSFL